MVNEFDGGAPRICLRDTSFECWWLSAWKDFGFLFLNSFVLIIFPFVKGYSFSLVIFLVLRPWPGPDYGIYNRCPLIIGFLVVKSPQLCIKKKSLQLRFITILQNLYFGT